MVPNPEIPAECTKNVSFLSSHASLNVELYFVITLARSRFTINSFNYRKIDTEIIPINITLPKMFQTPKLKSFLAVVSPIHQLDNLH